MAPGKGDSPVGAGVKRQSSLGKLKKMGSGIAEQVVSSSGVAKAAELAAHTAAAIKRPSLTLKKSSESLGGTPKNSPKNQKGQQDDASWKVGCRYQVNSQSVKLFSSPELKGVPVAELTNTDQVMLAKLHEPIGELWSKGPAVGLLIPKPKEDGLSSAPGWAVLEDDTHRSEMPIVKRKLADSFELGARYTLMSGATLRTGQKLSSEIACEVEKDEEVLAIHFGLNDGEEDDVRLRLRMLVKTTQNEIGWMSPETAGGDLLISPVNLLSTKVLEMQGKSPSGLGRFRLSRSFGSGSGTNLAAGATTPTGSTSPASTSPAGSAPPRRRSYKVGDSNVPWEVGGQYRVMEKSVLRAERFLDSKEIKKISAGVLVTIAEIHVCEDASLGWCPIAGVTVDEGPPGEKDAKGWLRCAAKDGKDILDIRDQKEYERVKDAVIRRAQEEEEAALQRAEEKRKEAQRQAEEAAEAPQKAKASEKGCLSCLRHMGTLFRKPKAVKTA